MLHDQTMGNGSRSASSGVSAHLHKWLLCQADLVKKAVTGCDYPGRWGFDDADSPGGRSVSSRVLHNALTQQRQGNLESII